jgi:hypothetical protein
MTRTPVVAKASTAVPAKRWSRTIPAVVAVGILLLASQMFTGPASAGTSAAVTDHVPVTLDEAAIEGRGDVDSPADDFGVQRVWTFSGYYKDQFVCNAAMVVWNQLGYYTNPPNPPCYDHGSTVCHNGQCGRYHYWYTKG